VGDGRWAMSDGRCSEIKYVYYINGRKRIIQFVSTRKIISGNIGDCFSYYGNSKFRQFEYVLFRKLFVSSFQYAFDFRGENRICSILDVDIEPNM